MCGIAGELAFPRADVERVAKMTRALAHRGPDGDGAFSGGPIAFGHRRLSIIDLEGGAQPIWNEDKSVCVILNGEIYNYRELRRDLVDRHTFATESDTEVLVHLYEEHGIDMLSMLRGMYAFAIWDARLERLLLARDRYGEKPLLYRAKGSAITFASEMRAFLEAGVDCGPIDSTSVARYLELLYVPGPRTIFRDVQRVPPAHALVADKTGHRLLRYWTAPLPGTASAELRSPRKTREILEEVVALQMRSDVPVGALLSGGLDSSTVVALMAATQGARVRTFSVGFGREDDELPFARVVAEKFGTEHTELVITDDVATQVSAAFDAYSEPFGDSSAVPSVAVCKVVAEHVKVVLTGDGGDELFAGYDRYRRLASTPTVPLAGVFEPAAAWAGGALSSAKLGRGVRLVASRGEAKARALVEVFPAATRDALIGHDAGAAHAPRDVDDSVDASIAFDIDVYLPDDLLVKMDTAAMHASLESRCPLLDHVLGEHVIPLPWQAKTTRTHGKTLLVDAIGDLLPPEITSRKKRGFGSPVDAWLRGPLRERVHDLLLDRGGFVREVVDGGVMDRVVRDYFEKRGNGHQIWGLFALEEWGRRFVRGPA